jgi:RecB family exonuclease
MHQTLAQFLRTGEDPTAFFQSNWREVQSVDLSYSSRESWESLQTSGQMLLAKFLTEERARITAIMAVETSFSLTVTGLAVPFVGVIDLIAEVDGQATVVDFKTAASRYEAHEVRLSDQLTAYQLAEPQSERMSLCVLLKTKDPSIDWHFAGRDGTQLSECLANVVFVANQIAANHFYRRPGKWCTWCDYLPVCAGDRRKAEETLIKVR